jgi:hypothetical protein
MQCNIAHALEKTKYPDSDIYWNKFDEKYHFSCQFTADIISMNNADFIITSTYQEIAGRFSCLPCCLMQFILLLLYYQLISLHLEHIKSCYFGMMHLFCCC